jgi:alkylation response protein AidB-like acyl-CoA dehydrogenase
MTVCVPSVPTREVEHEPARTPQAALEMRTWQARAREFAREAVAPVALVLEGMEARAAAAPGSPLFDLIAQAHREGFTRLVDPVAAGGMGVSRAAERMVFEEIACADAGLASVLISAPAPFRWARSAGDRLSASLGAAYLEGRRRNWLGCCAAGATACSGAPRALRDGDGWILTGVTSPLVPGALAATHAAIACTIERAAGRHALALVPLDRAGVRRGPALEQLGLRAAARAELRLDMVRLAADELIAEEPGGASPAAAAAALAHAGAALVAVGIARAACEGTLRLLGERHSARADGGRSSSAGRRLLRMQALVSTARSVAAAAHGYSTRRVDAGEPCASRHAAAAEAFAVRAASAVADAAMELSWPYSSDAGEVEFLDGSTFRPDKLLRDARSCAAGSLAAARAAAPTTVSD